MARRDRPEPAPADAGDDALPVALGAAGAHADAVRRFVEGVLGWQVVDASTAALVPPVLRLVDVAGAQPASDLPAVLLVDEGADPAAAAAAAVRCGAAAVLGWPAERDRLRAVASTITATSQGAAAAAELTVGGAAGGVGTTTVALALGGLLAWRQRPALVLSHGSVPLPPGPVRSVADLAGAGTWDGAVPAPGLGSLRVVRASQPARGAPVDTGPAAVVVRDLGVEPDADVLVLRRDAAGLAALRATGCAVVVVVDWGPASRRSVRAAAGRRRLVTVPWSVRVARAGLAGRVPAGLPGNWLRALRPALHGGAGAGPRRAGR